MEQLPIDESPSIARWDTNTQTPHGGQEWRGLSYYEEDFSVTTNALGTPASSLSAAAAALNSIKHYPAADFEPAWSSLASFLCGSEKVSAGEIAAMRSRLLLGNGASDLVDICIRMTSAEKWRPGPYLTQYKEYERCASNYGKIKVKWDDHTAALLCIVNPCNPTGQFMDVHEMKVYIERNCHDNATVLVDESMLIWIGSHWRSESLVSQTEWIKEMYEKKHIKVYVIHSWTKIWACPGIRLGSVLSPIPRLGDELRRIQTPWSVNSMAVAFLHEVVQDKQYLENTWEYTPIWRAETKTAIEKAHPDWEFHGVKWMSFIWINTKREETAIKYVKRCSKAGVPIRWAGHGYELPTYVRIGVRTPEKQTALLRALCDDE